MEELLHSAFRPDVESCIYFWNYYNTEPLLPVEEHIREQLIAAREVVRRHGREDELH